MNYYLARDGQTYGPYPQESFPAMLQQGQVVPQDLVCPEGGSDWLEVSKVPGLSGSAPPKIAGLVAPPVASSSKSAGSGPMMPVVAASSSTPAAMPVAAVPASGPAKLRISGGGHGQPAAHAPAAAAPAAENYPKATYAQEKPGLMAKAAGAWGLLRIAGFAVLAIVIVTGVIIGFVKRQGDKKEIAKLHSHPGWAAFNAGNSQIDDEDSTEGFGNTGDTKKLAEAIAGQIETLQQTSFPPPKRSRYRGRSKIGRITSAASSATAGLGKPQVYAEKHGTLIIALIHVPEFSRYNSSGRRDLSEACWETTHSLMASAMKFAEQARALSATSLAPTNRLTRPPAGRVPRTPGRAPAVPTNAPPPRAEPPKPLPDFTLVVGVRGSSTYECVYVGKVSAKGNEPAPTLIKENVPSHKELLNWFDPEQWKSDPEKAKAE